MKTINGSPKPRIEAGSGSASDRVRTAERRSGLVSEGDDFASRLAMSDRLAHCHGIEDTCDAVDGHGPGALHVRAYDFGTPDAPRDHPNERFARSAAIFTVRGLDELVAALNGHSVKRHDR